MAGASPDFDTFKEAPGRKTYNRHVLTGSVCGNLLNQLFLSDSNIKIIQNAIRYKVYEKIKREAGHQQPGRDRAGHHHARCLPSSTAGTPPTTSRARSQSSIDKVVEEVVPGIIGQAYGYQQYLIDATTQPVPIPRPSNVSSSGTKTLRSVTSVFA